MAVKGSNLAKKLTTFTQFWYAGDQSLGIGVLRVLQYRLGDACLDNLAMLHDRDPVTDLIDHGKVMGDKQQCNPTLPAQFIEQLEDLRLYGNIKSGGGLIGDDQDRIVSQCHGNTDPLALSSRELMGISAKLLRRMMNTHAIK